MSPLAPSRLSLLVAAALSAVGCATAAFERGLNAYEAGDYLAASNGLCGFLRDSDDKIRAEATFAMARSLEELGFVVAATYLDLRNVEAGPGSPSFEPALQLLADRALARDDHSLIPVRLYLLVEKDRGALRGIPPSLEQDMHFFLGTQSIARGKPLEGRDLLRRIPAGHRTHDEAERLLILLEDGDGATVAVLPRIYASSSAWQAAVKEERRRLEDSAMDSVCVRHMIDASHGVLQHYRPASSRW